MSRVFAITLALSTAAHLAAVGFGRPTTPAQAAGGTVVALTLMPPATPRAATTPSIPHDSTPRTPPAPRPRATHPAAAHAPMQTSPASTHGTVAAQVPMLVDAVDTARPRANNAADTPAAAHADNTNSDALLQHIQALLSGRFHYPRLARKRGWEGIVEIALNLAPDGRVTQVQLHRASGHAVLDNAALDSANRLRAVPNAATLLQGRAREMIIPIHYRLRES